MSFGYQVLGFGSFPNRGVPIDASGGTKTTSGIYTIHTFNSSGTFTVNSGASNQVEFLIVAGGGSGGSSFGGGGGAGGYRSSVGSENTGGGASTESRMTLSSGSYSVTVGAGGTVAVGNNIGGKGSNSVFNSITSIGGGGGGCQANSFDAAVNDGGSGGAPSHNSTDGFVGDGTAGQGSNSGPCVINLGSPFCTAGGVVLLKLRLRQQTLQ